MDPYKVTLCIAKMPGTNEMPIALDLGLAYGVLFPDCSTLVDVDRFRVHGPVSFGDRIQAERAYQAYLRENGELEALRLAYREARRRQANPFEL